MFRILTNPVYSGRFVYGARGRTRVEALADGSDRLTTVRVTPIVDVALWDAVQVALVRRRSQRRGRGDRADDQFILRGLLTCGHCRCALSTFWNRGKPNKPRIRYYKCIHNEPHRAARLGKVVCPMRDVLAKPLEELVWQLVACTLLEPEQLRAGLASARARHDELLASRQDRLQVLREIASQRKRLERIVDEMLENEKGSETYSALAQRQKATEDMLQRLQAEQAEQTAGPSEGLSAEQAVELERFAAEVGAGLETASTAKRRWVYERLRLGGTVRVQPDGIKLGQRHCFDMDFQAVVPIADSISNTKNKLVAYPLAVDFLRRHLLTIEAAAHDTERPPRSGY